VNLRRTTCPDELEGAFPHGSSFWADGDVSVIVQRTAEYGWHLSIARRDRLPSWEEVRDARYALIPDDAQMAMLLPPRAEYVNVHDHCLQLIEVHASHGRRGTRFEEAW
jgi:hypothetical protein